ncbi:hypothetical protein SUGI_0255390 [Cryptomeria japonica]|nr:hypothetical protein SUGI_0255390 [Cryptomeria japonica]
MVLAGCVREQSIPCSEIYKWRALYAKGDEMALVEYKVDERMLSMFWTEKDMKDGFKNILKANDISLFDESELWTAEQGKQDGKDIKIMLRTRNMQETQLWDISPSQCVSYLEHDYDSPYN